MAFCGQCVALVWSLMVCVQSLYGPQLKNVTITSLRIRCSSSGFTGYLEKHPSNRQTLNLFFGLLGGYIIAITGHRKGVVINMTREEVENAERTKTGDRIIRVSTNTIIKINITQEAYSLFN